jgi:hypothetical protein
MLFYLDNWLSADPKAAEQVQQVNNRRRGRFGGVGITLPRQQQQQQQQKQQQGPRRNGLNENYARELMELHTLGVDGGYTQQDIIEVARAFTGWTLANPQEGDFRFAPQLHDRGEKKVLGHAIKAGGGMEDGERVLDIVAEHPSTAKHIATKLVRRFVSDEPPAALVDKVAATFTKTKGNLREVMRTLVTSPEFYAARVPRRQGQDAARVRRQRRSRHGSRRARATSAPAGIAATRHGAVPVPAADGLRRHRGNVGVCGCARHAHEHRAAAGAAASGNNRRAGLPASVARGDSHDFTTHILEIRRDDDAVARLRAGVPGARGGCRIGTPPVAHRDLPAWRR